MRAEMFRETGSVTVRVVMFKDGEDWVAHCLDMDLVATGNSLPGVKKEIEKLMISQIGFALKNDNLPAIFRPAPPEIFAMLAKSKRCERELLPEGIASYRTVDFCYAT